jgi:hypothetical protein
VKFDTVRWKSYVQACFLEEGKEKVVGEERSLDYIGAREKMLEGRAR